MSGSILDHLRTKAAAGGGFLSFEEFMRAALYHPHFGYYARHARDVGRHGDFSTAATLHPALGEAVAAWAGEQPDSDDWVEVGAGSGELALNVLKSAGWRRRRRVRYRIVEVSPALRKIQQERLRGFRVTWHGSVAEALEAAAGEALVFSNELVDAFPCVRVEWTGEAWMEIGLSIDGERSAEALRKPTERIAPFLPEPWPGIAVGQRCELHPAYREWLAAWLPALACGSVLTIDYGNVFPQLYRRWPQGTVRAYFRQERYVGTEVYQRAGRQDLTCDVNFTDLRRWGEELGLKERAFTTQREFMLEHRPQLAARSAKDPALSFLLDEAGAGGAFQVLWQERPR